MRFGKWAGIFILLLLFAAGVALGAEGHAETDLMHQMMILVLELAVIIFAAKMGGEFFDRVLKQPAVLGELVSGMIIGPYALGALSLPVVGVLFPIPEGADFPISPALYGIATLASIILLFLTGLETDFQKFMRYSLAGALVGIGGVVGSFFIGDWIAVAFGFAPHFMHPTALFMGTISTATSVGITARVLSEEGKIDEPEGVTIIAGAVIDDVIGIIILAVVVSMSHLVGSPADAGGEHLVNWGEIGWIALRAIGFWFLATSLGLLLASRISRLLGWFKGPGTAIALGFGFALLMSGLAESAGLAMIIGAYIMGLSLAREKRTAHMLENGLKTTYQILVPVFFCVMGMMVNFKAMMPAFWFGLVYSVLAIIGKVLGGGLPTLAVGFNLRGAIRIGTGMLPRGEVALIVAGVGLASGVIGNDMFGVAIMMTLITTMMSPPILLASFRWGGPGLKVREGVETPAHVEEIDVSSLPPSGREYLRDEIFAVIEGKGLETEIVSFGAPFIAQVTLPDGEMVTIEVFRESIKLISSEEAFGLWGETIGEAITHAKDHLSTISKQFRKKLDSEGEPHEA